MLHAKLKKTIETTFSAQTIVLGIDQLAKSVHETYDHHLALLPSRTPSAIRIIDSTQVMVAMLDAMKTLAKEGLGRIETLSREMAMLIGQIETVKMLPLPTGVTPADFNQMLADKEKQIDDLLTDSWFRYEELLKIAELAGGYRDDYAAIA